MEFRAKHILLAGMFAIWAIAATVVIVSASHQPAAVVLQPKQSVNILGNGCTLWATASSSRQLRIQCGGPDATPTPAPTKAMEIDDANPRNN